jgi:GNAT superfamily N-acetyltransferase
MTDITIRQYDPADLNRCRDLWVELAQHHRDIYDDPNIGGDSPGLFFDKHLASVGPEHIWVAEHAGEVVGFVGLIVRDHEAEVEPVVVAASQRGKGVGFALLARMVREAKTLGKHYLTVKPVARNLEAISFYYEAGFQKLGEIEMFMELKPSEPGKWLCGVEIFGHSFEY